MRFVFFISLLWEEHLTRHLPSEQSLCVQYSIINYKHSVVQSSRTHSTCITKTLDLVETNSPFFLSPLPAPGKHRSAPCFYVFDYSISHISGSMQCLLFRVWLISLACYLPGSSVSSPVAGLPSCSVCIIFLCMNRPHLLRGDGWGRGPVQNKEEELGGRRVEIREK